MARIDDEFARLSGEINALREEMRAGFAELRGDLFAFHRQMMLIVAGFAIGLLGLLGVFVAAQL